MFEQALISDLASRIGWSTTESLEYYDKLDTENKTSESGRFFNHFHGLVTVENIYWSHPQRNITDIALNEYLKEIKEATVREILTDIFITDSKSESKDYSGAIESTLGTGLFDDAIGYCHAIKVLELIMTSVRTNRNEKMNKQSYATLKSEIEGFYNKEGVLAAKGLMQRCRESRQKIREHYFGNVYGVVVCDITNCW